MRPLSTIAAAALVCAATPGLAQSGPTQDELDAAQDNTSDWLYATHDYTGQRYVALDQINSANAGELRPVCLYQLGETTTFQTNSIVYDGVLFISTPLTTAAIDASNCAELWRYEWEPRNQPGIPSQRGLAIKDGMLVRGTSDGYVIALDATDGELLWAQNMKRPDTFESISMAPLIYDDLVVVGPAGTDSGWVAALSLESGEEVWRFSTMPGPGDPALETWSDPEALFAGEVGGGSVWTVLSFDRERELLYVPVGNSNPAFYGGDRLGDNLYTNSIVVLDIRTGERQWHYQLESHGVHNWDTSQAGPLFTATIDGEEREVVVGTGKNGVLHIVDRETHEPWFTVPVTTMKNVAEPLTAEGVHVCPGYLGGVQWNGPAYNPGTGLLYVGAVDWCSVFFEDPEAPRGGGYRFDPPQSADGWVTAVDPDTGQVRWRYQAGAPVIAAVTTTAGEVVFTGTLDGNFVVLNARNGDELYRFNTGGAMAGGVVTYQLGPRQYVAAMSGNDSGLWGSRGSPTVAIFALP